MIRLELTQGFFTVLDDEDAATIATWRWKIMRSGGKLYASRTSGKTTVLMHREIMGHPPCLIDHINGDGLDNRRSNLRLASASENQWNRAKGTAPSTSKYKGVYWNKEKCAWQAQIRIPGDRNLYIGRFDTEQAAADAYDARVRDLRGEFGVTNARGTR